jgi:two-component sensor histidine kinase
MVHTPSRAGFGSRLIAASLRSDLAGEARTDYRPSGLVCVITLSLPPTSQDEAEA